MFKGQELLKLQGETDKPTIIVRDFNNPLSIMGRIRERKMSKEIKDLNNAINGLDLIDIYKILHQNKHSFQIHTN